MSVLLLVASFAQAATPLTMAEVARHDQPSDCWLVLDGTVYDVTGFVAAHPGSDAIVRGCGKDATWFFTHRDGEAGDHSASARAMLDAFALGPLGAEVDSTPRPALHPHAVRSTGTYAGMLPTTGITPARNLHLRVRHHMPTREEDPLRVAIELGVGIADVLDVHVGDVTGDGVSGLETRVRLLNQHSDRGAPLSAAVGLMGGMAHDADGPAAAAELMLEHHALDRRLQTRLNGTWGLSDALPEGTGAAAGGGVELRPIPVHGVFASVWVPVAGQPADAPVGWDAGLRFYTAQHHISVYAASPGPLATVTRAAPSAEGVAIGLVLERDFRVGR